VLFLVSIGSATAQITCHGPVAFYPFDGTTNDTGAFANNPTVITDITFNPGFQGQAAVFNGTSSFIDIPVNIGSTTFPTITFGAWVNADTGSDNLNRAILSHDNGGFDRQIGIDERDGGFGYAAFTGVGVLNSKTIQTGTFQFVAARYDGDTVTLFVDGQSFSSNDVTGDG